MAKQRKPLAKIPPRKWQLAENNDGPDVAAVERLKDLPSGLEPIEVPDALKGRLDHFVRTLPGMGAAAAVAGGSIYACTFNNAGAFLHRNNGTIQSTVVGPGGKIIENGTILPSTAVQVVAGVAAAWMVMSVVTGQHFLADISERLGQLQQRLEELYDYIKTKDRAKLEADAKALQDIYAALIDRPGNQGVTYDQLNSLLDQIITVERDTAATLVAQMKLLEKKRKAIAEWKAGQHGPVGDSPDTQRKKLAKMIEEFAGAYSCACAAAYVRGIALTLAEMLPSDNQWVRFRSKDLNEQLDKLSPALRDLEKSIESKIPQIDSWYFDIRGDKHRKGAKKHLKKVVAELAKCEKQGSEVAASLDRMLAESSPWLDQQLELVMNTAEDGRITEVYRRTLPQ